MTSLLANGAKLSDVGRQLQVPQCIETAMRPGMVFYLSGSTYFIELMMPMEEVFERKKQKYAEQVTEVRQAHTSGDRC